MAEVCDFADAVMIGRLGAKMNWRKPQEFCEGIEKATGRKISESTIKRALRGEPSKAEILKMFADTFKVPEGVVTIRRGEEKREYSWEDIMVGANQVAKKIAFRLAPQDAVLTFPGASSIFTGLVLVSLRKTKRFLRIPVYSAILTPIDDEESFEMFRVAKATHYKILIPEALFRRCHMRLFVIDDIAISGGTMDALRGSLEAHFGKGNVKYACCIHHKSLAFGNRTRPDIIGLTQPEESDEPPMPWGIKGYRNEQGFS